MRNGFGGFLIAVLFSAAAFGQTTSLTGSVADLTGALVPGAKLTDAQTLIIAEEE